MSRKFCNFEVLITRYNNPMLSDNKWGKWNGLITTNRKLDFFEAYRIYSRRWSLEVVFKESIN